MHYYSHHVGDYNRDTAHLSIVEHGVYRLLMDSYYSTERQLPADKAMLCRIVRANSKAERDAVSSVASLFFHEHEGLLSHNRIERELESYQAQREQASRAGKASAAKRISVTNGQRSFNGRSTDVELSLQQNVNGTPTNHKPLTSNHEPIASNHKSSTNSKSPAGFDEFWTSYPRKIAKGDAEKAWSKIKPDLQVVLTALNWQTKLEDWTKENGKFVPFPATYLNSRRYEDEKPAAKPSAESFIKPKQLSQYDRL